MIEPEQHWPLNDVVPFGQALLLQDALTVREPDSLRGSTHCAEPGLNEKVSVDPLQAGTRSRRHWTHEEPTSEPEHDDPLVGTVTRVQVSCTGHTFLVLVVGTQTSGTGHPKRSGREKMSWPLSPPKPLFVSSPQLPVLLFSGLVLVNVV
jgi:hypothetical protein